MEIEEFKEFKFRAGLKAIYKNKTVTITTVDFEENLIGINGFWEGEEPFEPAYMVRCENIKILTQTP